MRLFILAFVLLSLLCAGPATAQESDLQLPEYTAEQRWQRLAFNAATMQAAILEFGRQHGMTAEEVGTWLGEFYARGWLSGQEAAPYAVAVNRNHMMWPGATSEVLSSTPTTVQVRLNLPWEEVIGPDGQIAGSTAEEFRAMSRATTLAISDWVGIDVGWDEEEDFDVLHLRTEYGPIQASNDIRWARGAFLSWNSFFNLLELKMQSGMTAREVGREAGSCMAPVGPRRLLGGCTGE